MLDVKFLFRDGIRIKKKVRYMNNSQLKIIKCKKHRDDPHLAFIAPAHALPTRYRRHMDARLGGGGWSQVVVGAEATLEVQRVEVGRPQERPRCGRPAGQRVGPPTTGRERLRPGVKPASWKNGAGWTRGGGAQSSWLPCRLLYNNPGGGAAIAGFGPQRLPTQPNFP